MTRARAASRFSRAALDHYGIPYDYSKQEVYLGSTGDPDARHFIVMLSVGFILD